MHYNCKRILKLPGALLIVAALLSSCGTVPAASRVPATASPSEAPSLTPFLETATPTATDLPPTATPTIEPTPALAVCSPLEGYNLANLAGMVTNPYHPPKPGSDDPHHGVDLAVVAPDSRIALAGHPVTAALSGQVVSVIHNRFPYGNAVLIETPLELASPEWWAQAGIPTPAPTLEPHSALTCPAFTQTPTWDSTRRSVYVLYAHMQSDPPVAPGQVVSCGQVIGQIGDSGNALNPHLHFEVRVGPAAAALGSMAHYDASATNDEMATYCLWRVSGLFQLVDPLRLLETQP